MSLDEELAEQLSDQTQLIGIEAIENRRRMWVQVRWRGGTEGAVGADRIRDLR